MPFSPPISPINRATLSLLNRCWRTHAIGEREIDYMKWLYPLDSIGHWNRLYGRAGFRQFQCVVPAAVAREAIGDMLRATARFGEGSFLAVLKNFGGRPSPGLMSFPMPGTTLALDFPHRPRTVQLLDRLHAIALDAGGRIYAAKDSCAPAASLARGYPNLERFRRSMDPGLSSVLARRLELTSEDASALLPAISSSSAPPAMASTAPVGRGRCAALSTGAQPRQVELAPGPGLRSAQATRALDVDELGSHQRAIDGALAVLGNLDIALIAHGDLPDQRACELTPRGRCSLTTNGLVVSLVTLIAQLMREKDRGSIVVIGSVAGDRGRKSNYVYGATKAMVATFLEALPAGCREPASAW